MAWGAFLDLLFPAQCAVCNALGSGLCVACRPARQAVCVRFPMLTVNALGPYEGNLRIAVLALKDGRRDVARALGEVAADLVARGSLLLPIPTTARRRRIRGVDGVALLASRAAEVAGAQVLCALEQRRGDAQRGRTRAARLAARGRFGCDATVARRRVTLFDDVCTTGATLRDCAAAVRAAGGLVEDAVVLAVTKSGEPWRTPPAH